MKAVLSYQKLEYNLNWIGRDTLTIQQINEINEVKQAMDHLRIMPVICEFHLLVGDLPDRVVKGTVQEIY